MRMQLTPSPHQLNRILDSVLCCLWGYVFCCRDYCVDMRIGCLSQILLLVSHSGYSWDLVRYPS
jgi:hypothetical protein